MKNFTAKLLAYIFIAGGAYVFLTICNWTDNPVDWNGVSRFLLAIFVIAPIKIFFD